MAHGAPLIPCLRYRDAAAAVDWLCRAFGFRKLQVFADGGGSIVHAELAYGGSVLMIGPVADTEFGRFMRQPDDAGGVTQSVYVIVEEVDAHCDRARAAGAEILLPPKDQDYGGRDYTCRDPEGHVWSFGTYDPWTAAQAAIE